MIDKDLITVPKFIRDHKGVTLSKLASQLKEPAPRPGLSRTSRLYRVTEYTSMLMRAGVAPLSLSNDGDKGKRAVEAARL